VVSPVSHVYSVAAGLPIYGGLFSGGLFSGAVSLEDGAAGGGFGAVPSAMSGVVVLDDMQPGGGITGLVYPAGPGEIVADGDSLTFGYALANPADSYPSQLDALLPAAWTVFNTGISGQTCADMQAARSDVDSKLGLIAGSQVNICWGGTNDIYGHADAATVQARIQAYCNASRTAGWRVIVLTLLPRNLVAGAPITGAEHAAIRTAANTWLRANWASFANAIVDVGGDSRIGIEGCQNDLTYYQADGTHLTAAGYAVVASLVAVQLAAAIA